MRQGYSDPGFVNEAKIGLNDLVRLSYRHADITLIGDGNHTKDDLFEHFGEPETAVALAESGVTQMFIEVQTKFQEHVDHLANGDIDKEQFIKDMLDDGFNANHRDDKETLGEIADIVKRANQAGIEVHCADLGNGVDEMVDAIVEKHFFEEGRYPNAVTQETVNVADKKSWDARLDDRGLAEFINDRVPEGEKAVVIYGYHHGSLFGDFEEHLREDLKSVKIDVHPSEGSFEASQRGLVELNDRAGTRLGEDAPDMIYIMSGFFTDGRVYTTGATSKELSDDIKENAESFKTSEKSDPPDVKPEENYAPQPDGAQSDPIKPM